MLETLLLLDHLPEVRWEHGDDLCDCTFQRIGYWANPYIGRTLEFRLCCSWAKLIELHPELQEFAREIPAFDNYNIGQWETKPAPWDSEDEDMPYALWHRQLAVQQGITVAEARERYGHLQPPKRVQRGANGTSD